jgi:glucokinase
LPTTLGNDCDVAGLAEAHFGAGRGNRVVFYVTVGTGIGGGLIIEGRIHRGGGMAAAEIGHLRPGPQAESPDQTVEAIASGWGIEAAARERMRHTGAQLTAQQVAQAASGGDAEAATIIEQAVRTLGWAIAQVITLLSPEVVIVGGGVSLMSKGLFLKPLREHVARYVFPPLEGSYRIEPAELGEAVVVQGALKLAADAAL